MHLQCIYPLPYRSEGFISQYLPALKEPSHPLRAQLFAQTQYLASGSSVKFVGYASSTLPVYVHLKGLAAWL